MPQRTVPTPRLLLAWAVMLGGMGAYWAVRPLFDGAVGWAEGSTIVLFVTSKIATLLCMPSDDRHRLGWGRFVAYLLWPGMQPRQFLPERTPAEARPAPTVVGMLLNAVVAVVFLWGVPLLIPADWPDSLRIASGMIGYFVLVLFAAFDALALLYRALGLGVEKLWHCPIAATSLADFWGQRWNRIFSGMLRDVLFLPLARRVGPSLALCAAFLSSGLLHESLSVAALGGFGLPFLYFVIQGAATWLEGRRGFRRVILRRPWLGWLWTAAVVLGPVTLLFHEDFRRAYSVPRLVSFGVPGLQAGP
jgi:hypothetical protein